MQILVLNGGSSSLKCSLYEISAAPSGEQPAPKPVWASHLDWDSRTEIPKVLEPLLTSVPGPVDMVGHRIVHGGSFHQSALLSADVRSAIEKQSELAPAHNRFELASIESVDRILGKEVHQVAVFDTAFHSTLSPAAYVYPGPYSWLGEGIRRYGFHGISYQYAARRTAAMLGGDLTSLRLIVCHLGSGASLAAIQGGRSVDTTMGCTPLEGLMMGTRSGSIDPGILIYLLRHRGYTADQLDRILNQESGLLGVSGQSSDMREILAAIDRGDDRARLAFDVYTHRVVKEVGSMLAVLGGVDAFVFTGGVGENCPPLREAVARQFSFLGMKLDSAKNAAPQPDQDIAAGESTIRTLVIHAEEEWEIACECHRLASA